ncbi:DUF6266 family protein [Pedobacter sp. GR22-6]|uniref:DUF6266 family protein n=1 Tax=Pedobacter sp. GR22-6 TaxID=3127957 RepID=UPI00307F612C
MGRSKNGPFGPHNGKIGRLVYYQLNGQEVNRSIGINNAEPTVPQLRNRLRIKLTTALLKDLLEFLQVGFSVECLGTTSHAYNMAVKNNGKQVISGDFPDLKIDYKNVCVSKGESLPAVEPKIELLETGLKFSWKSDPKMAWPDATDQVMMLAYFPETQESIFTLYGQCRSVGSDTLAIPVEMQSQYMETYISFIAADRKKVSNSTYMGSFNQSTI